MSASKIAEINIVKITITGRALLSLFIVTEACILPCKVPCNPCFFH